MLLAALVAAFALVFGRAARGDAVAAAREAAGRRAALEVGALVAEIDKFRVLPFVLVELPDVDRALAGSPPARARLDATLAALARQTGATVLYAIDRDGLARAASNVGGPDSFVGSSFRFRPYFLGAMRTGAAEYFAQGSVTGRPGLFLARRVGPAAAPAGVIVVKIEFDRIERLWRAPGQRSLVATADGVIVIAGDRDLRLRTLGPLAPARRDRLRATRQFGDAGLVDSGLRRPQGDVATDAAGLRYIAVERALPIPGWRYLHLEPLAPVIAAADARSRAATLIAAVAAAALLLAVGWTATRRRRLAAGRAALEAEVARRTAELSGAYDRLREESAERARADERYRAAREELAQANRLGSIGTITTSVAHEINQPVAAIRTAAENGVKLLARGRAEPAGENLALIVTLTQRIGAITGELLSYARRGRSGPAAVALDAVVDGALMLIGDAFRRKAVLLEVERDPDLPQLHASRIRLEQVLVNLLRNALDAVAGQPDVRVRLRVTADDRAIRFLVEDNGPGLPPDLGDTVFQPFVTGKPHGTGLGLGISREIVAEHGGTLTAGRSPLGGAVFAAVLPRRREEPR